MAIDRGLDAQMPCPLHQTARLMPRHLRVQVYMYIMCNAGLEPILKMFVEVSTIRSVVKTAELGRILELILITDNHAPAASSRHAQRNSEGDARNGDSALRTPSPGLKLKKSA